jgi:hypothetical protein
MEQDYLFLGIDPGWKNLGWGIVDVRGKHVAAGTLNPSEYPIGETPLALLEVIEPYQNYVKGACMERYVTYRGKHNPDSEHILLVTGSLQYMIKSDLECPLAMYKAIDWKTPIAKHIYLTTGQENPSDSLDKVFSMFAGEILTGKQFKVDHEADASCLAWLASASWARSNRSR